MESRAAVGALEGIESSVAALAVSLRPVTGSCGASLDVAPAAGEPAGGDPLRDRADAFLDGLAEVARTEARLAALKVHLAAGYAAAAEALAAPARSPQEHTAQEMAVTAEVACVLTVSERTAAALLCEARTLTGGLPLTLAALQAGSISWQHARILCDETANLDPGAAAALEGHFLDPAAVNPARGCLAGELVPGRFRAKARTWRERHHPVSIETRHTRSVADRRLDYVPDRDGMAWLSAYLPADTAAGIWDRATTAARALQGPTESRTLTQLRADVAAAWQLGAGNAVDGTGSVDGTVSPAGPGNRVACPELPGGGNIGPELREGAGFGRALEGAGGGGPVPDPGRGVSGQVRRQPGHPVPVRDVVQPAVRGAPGMAGLDADRVVPFPPGACLSLSSSLCKRGAGSSVQVRPEPVGIVQNEDAEGFSPTLREGSFNELLDILTVAAGP